MKIEMNADDDADMIKIYYTLFRSPEAVDLFIEQLEGAKEALWPSDSSDRRRRERLRAKNGEGTK